MSADPATTLTLATLRDARARQEAAQRWMRPLGPLIIGLVTLTTVQAHPGPGLTGRGLAISVSLGGFLLGALGALSTRRGPDMAQVAFLVALFVSSAALVWLQPAGTGFFGLFISVALVARKLPGRFTIVLLAISFVFVTVTTKHRSVVSELLTAIAIGGFYGITIFAHRLREANEQAERLLIELERTRAAQARAAALAERQRLAREMHDVLAHSLSGLMLQLEGARMLAAGNPGDPRLPETIERAQHLGRAGLEEARRAIGMLRDDDLPGPQRLASLATQFEADRGIPCQFTVSGQAHELGPEARLALYRVAQEALTNVAKHAHPARVEVCLAYEPRRTLLTVEDFTASGSWPGPASDGGYGLTGMRERAELLGGQLTAAGTGSGFRVELQVPA